LPEAQFALDSCLSQVPFLLLSTDFPGSWVVCFVAVLAGVVVDATCAKFMPVKNASMIKVKMILDAVFMFGLFNE
jgi:hypothetical protein